jgi:hypothetical protein
MKKNFREINIEFFPKSILHSLEEKRFLITSDQHRRGGVGGKIREVVYVH